MSTHNIGEAILMSTHNIGFYEELMKTVFKLLSNIIKYTLYLVILVFIMKKKFEDT